MRLPDKAWAKSGLGEMGSTPTHPFPQTLGKYELLRKLGHGAAGTVFLARDTLLDRSVALKILDTALTSDRAAVERFILEARSASQLKHPNTVQVHEIDKRDGLYYIAMEWLEGGSVQDVIDNARPIPWQEATRWVTDACRGLEAAHEAGMLHRDVKPANLLRGKDGGIKLADFGLVKLLRQSSPMLTALGGPLGTPGFMSPEQCQGERLDVRSDVYSLGATYFALLTGKPPFESETHFGVMFAHCASPIPDPRDAAPEIPEACCTVIQRAMAKMPADRYASAGDMLAALEQIVDSASVGANTVTTCGQPTVRVLLRPAVSPQAGFRRRRLAIALPVAALVVALVGIQAWRRLPSTAPTPLTSSAAGHPSLSPIEAIAISPVAATSEAAKNDAAAADAAALAAAALRTEVIERQFISQVLLGTHRGAVTDLEYSSTGATIATADARGFATEWRVDVEESRQRDYFHPQVRQPYHALAYCGPRQRLVTPWAVGQFTLWDCSTGTTLDVASHPHQTIRAMEFSPDGRYLATGGDVGLHWWEVTDDDKFIDRGPIATDMPMVSSIVFSSVTDWLGAVGWNGEQRIWNWRHRTFDGMWRYAPARYTSLVFGKDRLEWAWCTREGDVAPYLLLDREGPHAQTHKFDWSPSDLDCAYGRRLLAVVGNDAGEIWFVNLETDEVSRIATGLGCALTRVRFSPTDYSIAVGSSQGHVLVAELPQELFPPQVSEDSVSRDRSLLVWRRINPSRDPLLTRQIGTVRGEP